MMKRTMRKWFYFDGSDAKTAEACSIGGGRRAGGGQTQHMDGMLLADGGEGTLRRDDKAAGDEDSAPSAGTRLGTWLRWPGG